MLSVETVEAAIYSRYSTDLQNERSTEDQIDLCKAFAKREGFSVVATYADKAISGASIHGRHDLQLLMQDAHAGKFKVIIVEAFDRLSRDLADMAMLYKQMAFLGVRIVTVNDGEADLIRIMFHGFQAQSFREGNVHKIRRGMSGLIKQGLSAGGKAYGYRPSKKFDERGEPIRGELQIVEEEATIVVPHFRGLRQRRFPEGHLQAAQCRTRQAAAWQTMGTIGALRLRIPWHRHVEKPPVCGRTGLEQGTHGQRPEHRQARVSAKS